MNKNKRIILFLCCCIPLRLSLVYLAKKEVYINVMGVVALLISIGFMYQFIVHPHKTGAFGGDSWWNGTRPVHALLYLIFAIMTFINPKYAYVVLLVDILLGTGFFINHYIHIP